MYMVSAEKQKTLRRWGNLGGVVMEGIEPPTCGASNRRSTD